MYYLTLYSSQDDNTAIWTGKLEDCPFAEDYYDIFDELYDAPTGIVELYGRMV